MLLGWVTMTAPVGPHRHTTLWTEIEMKLRVDESFVSH